MAFCPRRWDTGWLLALPVKEGDRQSPCQSDVFGDQKRKQPLPPSFSTVFLSLFTQHHRALSLTIPGLTGNNGSDSRAPSSHPHNPEEMNPLAPNLGSLLVSGDVRTSSSQAQMG